MNIEIVRNLVGNVTPEQLKYVDGFVCPQVGVFIPAVGPCLSAISEDHAHPAYSFILSYDDNCALAIEGRVIQSVPGTLSAMSPDIPHHELLTGNFARYAAVLIDAAFFEKELLCYSLGKQRVFKGEFFAAEHGVKQLIRDFIAEYENGLPGSARLLEALALRITHAIIRCVYAVAYQGSASENRMNIDRVIEFVHSRFDEKLDVERLAAVACLSPSHFARLFKSSVGKTPMEYLVDTRLEKARKLLLSGSFSVSETAYKCGFSSSSHFSNLFFQKTGQTPSGYRRTMQ